MIIINWSTNWELVIQWCDNNSESFCKWKCMSAEMKLKQQNKLAFKSLGAVIWVVGMCFIRGVWWGIIWNWHIHVHTSTWCSTNMQCQTQMMFATKCHLQRWQKHLGIAIVFSNESVNFSWQHPTFLWTFLGSTNTKLLSCNTCAHKGLQSHKEGIVGSQKWTKWSPQCSCKSFCTWEGKSKKQQHVAQCATMFHERFVMFDNKTPQKLPWWWHANLLKV